MKITGDLNKAVDAMLDGTKSGFQDYGAALWILNSILLDLRPIDIALRKYEVFEHLLEQRERYWAAADSEGVAELKVAARAAVQRGLNRIHGMLDQISAEC